MSGSLEEREVPCVKVADLQKVFATGKKFQKPLMHKMNPRSMKLPLSLQRMMCKQGVANSWPSPSPASLFPIQAATEWLFFFWDNDLPAEALEKAWMTILAGKPGTIVAQRSRGLLLKVVQAAEFGMLGWVLEIVDGPGGPVYMMPPKRQCLSWFHIWDLDDWVVVPAQPQLLNRAVGPLGWAQAGEPRTLLVSLCKTGVQLTVNQIKHLLKELGIQVPGNKKKRDYQVMLINACLPEEEREEAISKLGKEVEAEDPGAGSDMEEILDALGEDDANYQEVSKLKTEMKKRKKKQAKQEEVQTKKKKGKGKGRGRGKGRGKGRGRAGRFAGKVKKHLLKKHAEDLESPQKAKADVSQEEEQKGEDKTADFEEEKADAASSSRPEDSEPMVGTPSVMYEKSLAKPRGAMESEDATASSARRPKHKSPEEILKLLSPPGSTFGISAHNHRFTSRMEIESPDFVGRMKQKSMSSYFGGNTSWQTALASVHEFNWRKWHCVKTQLPLPRGQEEQVPGQIPAHIYQQLQAHIDDLPPLVKYTSSERAKKRKT
eukprot:Skav213792  [mRNA]  locus=scaffold1122:188741:190378:- [translate_table: standard]